MLAAEIRAATALAAREVAERSPNSRALQEFEVSREPIDVSVCGSRVYAAPVRA